MRISQVNFCNYNPIKSQKKVSNSSNVISKNIYMNSLNALASFGSAIVVSKPTLSKRQKEIICESVKLTQEKKYLLKKAKDIENSVREKISKKGNPKGIFRSAQILDEYASDGTLRRKTYYKKNISGEIKIAQIDIFKKDGSKNIIRYNNGNIEQIDICCRKDGNVTSYKKRFGFSHDQNGKYSTISVDSVFERVPEGTYGRVARQFNYSDDKLVLFTSDFETTINYKAPAVNNRGEVIHFK